MYQLIGNFRTRSQRIIWALMELGIEFEHVDVLPHAPEANAASPSGKVPILIVNGEPIWDSGAILMYLCDNHEGIGFRSGTVERARQDGYMLAAIDEIDGPLWTLTRAERAAGEQLPEMRAQVFGVIEKGLKLLEGRISNGTYIMGEHFTAADIYTAHALVWARSYKIPMSEKVTAYYKACYARPAAQAMRAKYL